MAKAYVARLERVDPKFYFHIKELSRITLLVAHRGADVLFAPRSGSKGLDVGRFRALEVNASLTPVQQRHLEAAMELANRAQRRGQEQSRRVRADAG